MDRSAAVIRRAWDWLRTNRLALLAGALGVIVPVLLLALMTTSDARDETTKARTELAIAREQLAKASALLHTADSARQDDRRRIDSLWAVIYATRVRAPRRTWSDSSASKAVLITERDVAIRERDEALVALEVMRSASKQLHATAITILVRDSTKDAQIAALLVGADSAVAAADKALHRPWWKRAGGAVKSAGTKVLVVAGTVQVIEWITQVVP